MTTLTDKKVIELYQTNRAAIRKALINAGESPADLKTQQAQLERFAAIKGVPFELAALEAALGGAPAPEAPAPAPEAPAPEAPAPEAPAPEAPAPAPAPAPEAGALAGAIAGSVEAALAGLLKPAISTDEIIALIHEHSSAPLSIQLQRFDEKPAVTLERVHASFPLLLDIVQLAPVSGQNLYLYGPAGSGKTTIGKQLAQSLSLPFYSTGAIFDKFELLGFNDVNGLYVETELYKAYTSGGVFLFDEIDGSAAEVLTAFNQLLANDSYCFPNGMQNKHADFYAIAAANTNGLGATGAYGTRSILDGATLDRFIPVQLDYDEELERSITHATAKAIKQDYNAAQIDSWLAEVRKVRAWLADNNSDIIVSPRASKGGAALLAKGHSLETVRKITIHAHLSADQIKQIAA